MKLIEKNNWQEFGKKFLNIFYVILYTCIINSVCQLFFIIFSCQKKKKGMEI